MRVYVSGDEPSDKKVDFALLENATKFMIERLFHHDDAVHVVSNLEVYVDVQRGLCERTSNDGLMYAINRPEGAPIEFEVYVDADLSFELFLKSLGHELAHVRQYALGQLSCKGEVFRWNGMVVDINAYDYYDLPWEISAHGSEFGLYARFIKHMEGVGVQVESTTAAAAEMLLSTLAALNPSKPRSQ